MQDVDYPGVAAIMVPNIKKGLPFEQVALAENVLAAITRLRDVDAKMSLEEAYTLLTVAAKPGIVQREIGEALGATSGSLSRVMGRLTEYGDRKTPGLDLIHASEDLSDRRHKPLQLTAKGRRLVEDVLGEILKGFSHVGQAKRE